MENIVNLPMPPTSGILGHVNELKKSNIHQQMLKWVNDYGTTFRLKFGLKNVLVLADHDDIIKTLKARPNDFRRLKNIESIFEEEGLNGIFSAEGSRWKHQRKLTEPMFNTGNIKHFYPQLKIITERFKNRFSLLAESGKTVDLLEEFKRYAVDITSILAFGEDFNSIENDETQLEASLRHVFPIVNQRCKSPIPLWRFFKTNRDRDFDESLAEIKQFVSKCIKKQRTLLHENKNLIDTPENMLQIMIAAQESDSSISDKDIIANAMTLLLAGQDTTANTLTWMAFLISGNKNAKYELFSEFENLEFDKVLEWPMPKLPYLTAIMYESMRLKPVAPQLYLEAISDTSIRGVKIKKGTPVFVLLHANGFDASLFDSPLSFNPNRWLGNNRTSFSNLKPFGGGARLCPGRSLAIIEINLAFHALFSEFDIIPQQSEDKVLEEFAFTMSPVGFNVKISQRKTQAASSNN